MRVNTFVVAGRKLHVCEHRLRNIISAKMLNIEINLSMILLCRNIEANSNKNFCRNYNESSPISREKYIEDGEKSRQI